MFLARPHSSLPPFLLAGGGGVGYATGDRDSAPRLVPTGARCAGDVQAPLLGFARPTHDGQSVSQLSGSTATRAASAASSVTCDLRSSKRTR